MFHGVGERFVALSEILNAMIWRARVAMRLPQTQLFAGHGVADANYRPRNLPYVSVVGPLNLEVEPDRELPEAAYIFAQTPGHLAGRGPMTGQPVPAPGQLHLTLDDATALSVPVDFGPDAGVALDDDVARRVARGVTVAIRTAVDGGAGMEGGQPVVAPDRLGELRRTVLRWEEGRARFVLISGRRAVVDRTERITSTAPSAVAVRPGPQDRSGDLGLAGDGTLTVPSRMARHRVTEPTAVAVDLRLDLWSGSQQHLADMLERWSVLTPTRGQLLTCPGMLRDDAPRGSRTLRILPGVWPVERWTLALLDAASGFDNRVTGRAPNLSGGAALANDRLTLAGNATAAHRLWDAPLLPPPDRPDHPAPDGYALMVEVQTVGAPQDGETVRVATLSTDAGDALSVTLRTRTRAGTLETVVEVRAASDNGGFAPRDFLVDPARLAAGVMLHVTLLAPAGRLVAFADGLPLPPDDDAVPPAEVPGTPLGAEDMMLTFGDAGGIDRDIRIRRAELLARPLGPMDPRLALTGASASRWRIGDPVALVANYDGRSAAEPFTAVVIGTGDGALILDRPLPRSYARATTVVCKRVLFFAQRQWRRRDDLINRMYRLSAEYRVSAFLEDQLPATTAPIVERPEVDLRDLGPMLAAARAREAGDAPPPPAPGVRKTAPGVATELVISPPVPARAETSEAEEA